MRRFVLVAATTVALSIPVTVGLVGNSSPAFAGSGLTCAKVSGHFNTKIEIQKCTIPSIDDKSYRSASVVVSTLASGGTFTWSKSRATTTLGPATISSPGQGRCGKFWTEQDITATVTGGTSVVTSVGDTFSADVCVYRTYPGYMSGLTKLVKGTAVSI